MAVAFVLSAILLQAGPTAQTASLRILAAIILVVMICGLIYVLRNVKSLKAETRARETTPTRQASYIMIFVACTVVFVLACVFLYLVARA